MKYRIRVYEKTNAQNATGFMIKNETPVHACRARRLDATTREVWEAMAAKERGIVNFEIRYHAGIRVGQWVECAGQIHEIIAVQRPEGLPKRMILKTTLKESRG